MVRVRLGRFTGGASSRWVLILFRFSFSAREADTFPELQQVPLLLPHFCRTLCVRTMVSAKY